MHHQALEITYPIQVPMDLDLAEAMAKFETLQVLRAAISLERELLGRVGGAGVDQPSFQSLQAR